MSISVERSNFTSVILKAACHVNQGAERNFARSSLYILVQIFLKYISQIHQLTIMYCFKHRNHDIILNVLPQNLCKLFLHGSNLQQ